jgi:hypothetical protein
MMFAIQAVRTLRQRSGGVDWIRHEQLPTFFVDGNVQGFFTEAGAAEVARRILDPFAQYADGDLTITAVEV